MEYYYSIFNSKAHDDVEQFIKKITFDEYKKIRYYLQNDQSLKLIEIIKEKLNEGLDDLPLILKEDFIKNHSVFIHNKLSNLILRSV